MTVLDWAAKSEAWLAHCAYRARWGEDEPLNVLYLDEQPRLAAQYHADAHIEYGIMSAAYALSTAWHASAPDQVVCDWDLPTNCRPVPPGELPYLHHRLGLQRIYRPMHRLHPCVHWVRRSTANYDWLWQLSMHLLAEYEHRYAHKHAVRPVLWTLEQAPPLAADDMIEPPLCIPEELKSLDAEGYWATVRSYRNYYVQAKQPLLKWTGRPVPPWLENVNGRFCLLA